MRARCSGHVAQSAPPHNHTEHTWRAQTEWPRVGEFEYVGVHAEGIGYVDGPEVKGWAKVAESIDKWKKINTKKAVDYLSPIYANKWHLNYIDGSMVGALSGIFNLLDVCGDGKKYSGLKEYLKTYFTKN